MIANYDAVFNPNGIALVGASGRCDSPAARPLRFLRREGYSGNLYPVNPKYRSIDGIRCYKSLEDIPGHVDLVLSMVPASENLQLIDEAAECGAGGMIITASGFSEIGLKGRKLEQQLKGAARKRGLRLLGPNCQGLMYSATRNYCTFSAAFEESSISAAPLAYIGQSGAIGGVTLAALRERNSGLLAWVSTGNQVDLDIIELGQYLLENTSIITLMVYLESIPRGERFNELAIAAANRGKRIIVLRSGKSIESRRAILSHTGSFVNDERAFDLLCKETGIVQATDIDEFAAMGVCLSVVSGKTQNKSKYRAAIISTSGGVASIATDQLSAQKIALARLSPTTQNKLKAALPVYASSENPIDLTADWTKNGASLIEEVCELVLSDDNVTAVIVILTIAYGDTGDDAVRRLGRLGEASPKPLILVWLAQPKNRSGSADIRDGGEYPVLRSIHEACSGLRAVSAVLRGSRLRITALATCDAKTRKVAQKLEKLLPKEECVLGETAAEKILSCVGIRFADGVAVESREEACAVARGMGHGAQVALKVQGSKITHKSSIGGVIVGVSVTDVGLRFEELLQRVSRSQYHGNEDQPLQILIQRMAPPGRELIIGVTASSNGYPPLLTIGYGGVETETIQDTISTLIPVDESESMKLLKSLRMWRLLKEEGADIRACIRAIVGVSMLAKAMGQRLREIEINPLIVHDHGAGVTAVDFVLVLAKSKPELCLVDV